MRGLGCAWALFECTCCPGDVCAVFLLTRTTPFDPFCQVESMDLVGSVEGSDAIIVDDMIDTAGTLCKAAQELKRHGGALGRAEFWFFTCRT